MGIMYQNGRGVDQDYSLAIDWYRKAANRGYAYSQKNLINMYRQGLGVPQDKTEALIWFLDIARQKNVVAQFRLGSIYHNGYGVSRNDIKAYAWYGIASAGGVKSAEELRDEIQALLNPEELEQAQKLSRELWEEYGNTRQDSKANTRSQ
jgi:hypothetical protein